LAKLQLPPDLPLTHSTFVPLPKRGASSNTSHHQLALVIREGRRVAHQLSAAADASKSGSSKETSSGTTTMTTMTTVLEQDFTVEGKKGKLDCPFSTPDPAPHDEDAAAGAEDDGNERHDPTPHRSADPICAAMFEEATSQPAPANGAATKCPIRFLDKHTPEEIANYVEKHKHEIPRSHEVCVRRYQKNEEQIRKLDAKYGNLVSMIKDLSQLHQPMLPAAEAEAEAEADAQDDVDGASNERVENWAQEVSATDADDPEHTERAVPEDHEDLDRESHFNRPLKEVRVGESPSRPWGISVPAYDTASHPSLGNQRPPSPPPAPVRMPSPTPSEASKDAEAAVLKCPFDHTKFALHGMGATASPPPKEERKTLAELADTAAEEPMERPFTPVKRRVAPSSPPRPTFINEPSKMTQPNAPQMLFTGPVFIGYPIEQAIQFMQHFQNQ